MATPFLGEILLVPFNFAPRRFAFCNGQILSIQQNTALFSLLGTTYGGNGTTNFALPDLQGRTPIGPDQSGEFPLGSFAGSTTVTLTQAELAAHSHAFTVSTSDADRSNATGNYLAAPPDPTYLATGATGTTSGATQVVGGSQPHNNRSPYLTINFVIALQGIFPARN